MTSLTITGGTISSDQSSVQISGTIDAVDAGLTIEIFDGSLQVGSATVDPSENWSTLVGITAGGVHSLSAQATDASGGVTSNTMVVLTNTATRLFGGGQIVLFAGTLDSVTLGSTAGNWDSVAGSSGSIALNDAQALVSGGGNTITLGGSPDDAVSLNATNYAPDTVRGSNSAIDLESAQALVNGGNNMITLGGTGDVVTIQGAGNTVTAGGNGQSASVFDLVDATQATALTVTALDNSFVSVLGDGVNVFLGNFDNFGMLGSAETITASGARDNIWIGGNGQNATVADVVTLQQGGAVHVLDASWVDVSGTGANVLLGASDTVALAGAGDAITFGQIIGQTTLSGFASSDQITLQKSSFSSAGQGFDYWAFLLNHSTVSGSDTTITSDANDTILLKGVTLTAANQAQFSFV